MKMLDLTLPSGGVVKFHDPDVAVTGKVYREFLEMIEGQGREDGSYTRVLSDKMCRRMAAVLVASWALPYEAGDMNGDYDGLRVADLKALSDAVSRPITIIFFNAIDKLAEQDPDNPVPPTEPAAD